MSTQAVIDRIEVMAATNGTAFEMVNGEEISCLVKYSRGAHSDKAYWKRNGGRVSSRSLRVWAKWVDSQTA